MSAIAGFLDLGKNWKDKPEKTLDSMAEVLRHRGPDMNGTFTDGPCFLAHQRLSIIDLSDAGKQPVSSRDGSVQMVYSGTTYNYKELKNYKEVKDLQ